MQCIILDVLRLGYGQPYKNPLTIPVIRGIHLFPLPYRPRWRQRGAIISQPQSLVVRFCPDEESNSLIVTWAEVASCRCAGACRDWRRRFLDYWPAKGLVRSFPIDLRAAHGVGGLTAGQMTMGNGGALIYTVIPPSILTTKGHIPLATGLQSAYKVMGQGYSVTSLERHQSYQV